LKRGGQRKRAEKDRHELKEIANDFQLEDIHRQRTAARRRLTREQKSLLTTTTEGRLGLKDTTKNKDNKQQQRQQNTHH
jgi:hypothetical protein